MPIIQGELQSVLKAGENGFFMAHFRVSRSSPPDLLAKVGVITKTLTIRAYLPMVQKAQHLHLTLEGTVSEGPRGPVFTVTSWKPTLGGKDQTTRFLLSLTDHTVASRVIGEKFPFDLDKVMTEDPDAVQVALHDAKVPIDQADKVVAVIRRFYAYLGVQSFLSKYGVTSATLDRLYLAFGAKMGTLIRQNPYLLLSQPEFDVRYVKDLVARHGLSLGEDAMTDGYVLLSLREASQEGHLFLSYRQLLSKVGENAREMVEETLTCSIDRLVAQKLVAYGKSRNAFSELREDLYDIPVYLNTLSVCEEESARILRDKMTIVPKSTSLKVDIYADKSFAWGEDQVKAIETFLHSSVFALTGLPGSGKTTTVKALLRVLAAHGKRVLLLAPTGMAARRLSDTVKSPALTIHRALGFDGTDYHVSLLDADVILLDEVSMVDQELLWRLLTRVDRDTQVILVGDDAQLPSVGPGNVFREVLRSAAIPHVRLTKIFRQEEASKIILGAHAIHRGEMPGAYMLEPESQFRFVPMNDPENALALIGKMAQKMEAQGRSYQVLAPLYKGPIGLDALNLDLRERLNPDRGQPTITTAAYTFRQDDKVIVVKNDYGKQINNGDLGRITRIERGKVTVDLGGKSVTLSSAECSLLLQPGYAISVHRSQGNEFGSILMPIFLSHGRMLQRNLLYTAVTRAKEKVLLVGQREALATALANDRIGDRNTRFAALLDDLV